MKKQRRGLNRYNVLRDDGDPWSAKQLSWKSEAKDHQLSPGGPSNRRKSSGPNQLKLIALGRGLHRV